MRLSEAFNLYIRKEIISMGGSPKTVEGYQNSQKLAEKYFGNIQVQDISLDIAQEYRLWLIKGHKISTARIHISCLRNVLKLCKKHGESVINYDEIDLPKKEKTYPGFLDKSEVDKLIETAGTHKRGYAAINRIRNVLIIRMLFETGLRVGELCSLNRNSIKNNTFSVVGKSKNVRVCFVTDSLMNQINNYLSMRLDSNPALFITNETQKRIKPANIQEMFRRISKKSGLVGVHPHTMRHSFATYLMENNIGLREIAEFLGHESMETTKIYTHLKNPRLKEVYESVMS